MYSPSISRFCFRSGKYYSSFNGVEVLKSPKSLPEVTAENQYELLSDVVTPWWRIDYAEQLLLKKRLSRKFIETFKTGKLQKRFRTVIHDVIPSPVIESYRNKDEFSIRTGFDGNEKTVGFFLGRPATGNTVCVPPTKLITLKEEHILLSQVFQSLIRSSPLTACHDFRDGGFWRGLVVRSNRLGEIMAIVTGHPDGATAEQIEEAKEQVKEAFLQRSSVSSIYFQLCQHGKCKGELAPYTLLHGSEQILENFDDITVRLSPDSFIPINVEAGLILYNRVIELLKLNTTTTLIDVCCGSGVLSLLASKFIRGCIGFEYKGYNIEDPISNASYNGISNCHFISSDIEQKLKKLLSEMASDVVLVLNPGRAGISRRIISLLRKRRNVERFVYLTSKADNVGPMNNFKDLCSRSFDSSIPFSLSTVQPVDINPQTPQCELILYFER